MKSVLISIRPQWVEKIASGEKTIEVRKTRPKLETPFKCYIYCTKESVDATGRHLHINEKRKRKRYGITNRWLKGNEVEIIRGWDLAYKCYLADGKVIGEFICDNIHIHIPLGLRGFEENKATLTQMCLTKDDLNKYSGLKLLYGWHISDLKIYDKPKELSEFYTRCNILESKCKLCDNCFDREDYYGRHYAVKKLTRPPQSWCYLEGL